MMMGTRKIVAAAVGLAAMGCAQSETETMYQQEREAMVELQIQRRGVANPAVLEALRRVPRHAFVPEAQRPDAYRDYPLPIGHGQTISQPYIVAIMTELVRPKPDHVVLEVGTGSGYQAAVLAAIVRHVYTIEIVPALGETARERLAQLGYTNVTVRVGDGYAGWKEHAPFDAIVVTAAPDEVPTPLREQLKPGGRMVIPVGPAGGNQELLVLEKRADGTVVTNEAMPVRFVPFTGDRGRPRSPE